MNTHTQPSQNLQTSQHPNATKHLSTDEWRGITTGEKRDRLTMGVENEESPVDLRRWLQQEIENLYPETEYQRGRLDALEDVLDLLS